MCDCKCGSSGPLVIQCGGATNQPGQPSPPTEEPGENPPEKKPKCSKVLVRVNTLRVNNAGSESFFDNPGDPADVLGDHQWNLTISVGDRSRTFRRDPVKDGDSFNLGFVFEVEIPDIATTFSIQASGFEDQNFVDNDLPTAEATHGSGDNFGLGSSHQIQGSDSDFDYVIDYTVSCATKDIISSLHGEDVHALVQEVLGKKEISARGAVSFFVNKMQRSGLRLIRAEQDTLMFEGAQSVRRVVRQVFYKDKHRRELQK